MQAITITKELGEQEVVLNEGGATVYVRVGNTVIDITQGYNHSGNDEPCAVVTIYPFDDKKKSRVLVYDNKTVILHR